MREHSKQDTHILAMSDGKGRAKQKENGVEIFLGKVHAFIAHVGNHVRCRSFKNYVS